jgi:hypothetical protein
MKDLETRARQLISDFLCELTEKYTVILGHSSKTKAGVLYSTYALGEDRNDPVRLTKMFLNTLSCMLYANKDGVVYLRQAPELLLGETGYQIWARLTFSGIEEFDSKLEGEKVALCQ